MKRRFIYIVDPDEAIIEALRVLLETFGFEVNGYLSAESFLSAECAGKGAQSCLLVEAGLPGTSGIELIETLRRDGSAMAILLLTSIHDPQLRAQAMLAGATAVLEKPLIDERLTKTLALLLPCVSFGDQCGA